MEKANEHGGDVLDALCCKHPTKIIKTKRKKALEVVDENLHLLFERSPKLLMFGLVIL